MLLCSQLRSPVWMEGDDFNTEAVMNICGKWFITPMSDRDGAFQMWLKRLCTRESIRRLKTMSDPHDQSFLLLMVKNDCTSPMRGTVFAKKEHTFLVTKVSSQ